MLDIEFNDTKHQSCHRLALTNGASVTMCDSLIGIKFRTIFVGMVVLWWSCRIEEYGEIPNV